MNDRFKNIYFILGVIGIIFTSADIDFNALTSWNLLFEALLSILYNPVQVVAVIFGILGVYTNPTTKGLKD